MDLAYPHPRLGGAEIQKITGNGVVLNTRRVLEEGQIDYWQYYWNGFLHSGHGHYPP